MNIGPGGLSFDGATFRYQGHRFNGNLGQSLSAAAGYLGPLDLVQPYQQNAVDRSGLRSTAAQRLLLIIAIQQYAV